jgi:hypothetical protein
MQGVSQKEQEEEKEKEKTAAEEKNTSPSQAAAIIFPENETDNYDYNCHSIIDQSIMLFDRIWNQPNKTPEEYRLVSEYITTYTRSPSKET